MPIHIREKRKLNFESKIITTAVIRQLAHIVEKEVLNLKQEKGEIFSILYSVDANDGSSYESQNAEIFNAGEIIEKKVITRINIRLQTFDNSKNIEVQITQSQKNETESNFIFISGENTTWVNGIMAQFSEILSLTKKQLNNNRWIDLSILPVTILFNIVYFRLFYSSIHKIKFEWISLILIIGFPILSITLFNHVAEYLKTLWPSVELQTGPSYLQIPSEKRKKAKWVLSAILIPIIIGFIYDFFKNLLHTF